MGTLDPSSSDSTQRGSWWSAAEHDIFVHAYEEHGKDWKKIAELVGTRTISQVRSHAQKYFMKLQRRSAREQAKLENSKLTSKVETDVPKLMSPTQVRSRERLEYENYLLRSYIQAISNVNLAFFREFKMMFGNEPLGAAVEQSLMLAWSASASAYPFSPSFASQ